MAHVFMPRCFDAPEGVYTGPVTVKITGNVGQTRCYAQIGGTKHTMSITLEVEQESVVTLYIYNYTSNSFVQSSEIYIDNVTVATATNEGKTYNWTIPKGVQTVNIKLEEADDDLYQAAFITVTTK